MGPTLTISSLKKALKIYNNKHTVVWTFRTVKIYLFCFDWAFSASNRKSFFLTTKRKVLSIQAHKYGFTFFCFSVQLVNNFDKRSNKVLRQAKFTERKFSNFNNFCFLFVHTCKITRKVTRFYMFQSRLFLFFVG